MNQILDHSGPKKQNKYRNPKDTQKIIRVYAFLIIAFALCFIAKGAYTLTSNQSLEASENAQNKTIVPTITLEANEDILTINVSADIAIEEISYQWYRGDATVEEINAYDESATEENTEDDDEGDEELEEAIYSLNDLKTEKGTGLKEMTISDIGIPRGDSTIFIAVRLQGQETSTETVQHYYTDVGVDRINPKINVVSQGTKLIITATDETELRYLTYSLNGEQEVQVNEKVDDQTITVEIELDTTADSEILINAVDRSGNVGTYQQTIGLYVGKPEITFAAESDFSKIYVTVKYSRGLTKIEYDLNGETYEEEYENPEEHTEVTLEVPTDEGYNLITVKAYTDQEEVYAEESGECEYNP